MVTVESFASTGDPKEPTDKDNEKGTCSYACVLLSSIVHHCYLVSTLFTPAQIPKPKTAKVSCDNEDIVSVGSNSANAV